VIYRATIAKLLFFTFAMITFPISSYFLTVHNLFSGTTTHPTHPTNPNPNPRAQLHILTPVKTQLRPQPGPRPQLPPPEA